MMRYVLAVAVLAGAAASAVHASDGLKAVVGSYLEIQRALASDTTEGVPAAARAIGEQAARMGEGGRAMLSASKAIESAADLKAARAAFGDLSEAVIAAAKAEGWSGLPDAKVAYCPMAGKSWIQKDEKIRNPYYGSSMLTCGEFKPR